MELSSKLTILSLVGILVTVPFVFILEADDPRCLLRRCLLLLLLLVAILCTREDTLSSELRLAARECYGMPSRISCL